MTRSADHAVFFRLLPFVQRLFFLVLLCILIFLAAPAVAAPVANPITTTAGTPTLLIFELRLDHSILADSLTVYEVGKDLLIPLGELTRLLTLGITINPNARVATGYILNEERIFRLDLATRMVTLSSGCETFDPSQARWLDDDIYVASQLLQKWFPLDFQIDLSTLTIDVAPREKLPLQHRLERERAAKGLGRTGSAYQDPGYPRAKPDYRLLSAPFIDQTLGVDFQGGHSSATNVAYSAYLTGDLLGMEGSLYLSASKNSDRHDQRLTLSRNDPDAGLLGPLHARSLALGNIGVPALNNVLRGSGSGNGVLLSNRPLTQSASYGLHTLRGDLPPGWDVTLYFNDALIGFQQSRPDGRYEFADQPLVFGVNEFRLLFNGPLGQARVERQLFLLDQTLTKSGEFIYTVGGQRDDSGQLRGSAQFDFGLAKQVALTGGMVNLALTDGGPEQRYYNLGLRTSLLGMLVNGDYVQAEQGESLYEFGIKTRLWRYSFDFTHTGLSADFASDFFPATSDQIRFRDRVRVSGALPLGMKLLLPVALDFTREETQSGILTLDLQGRLSLNLLGTSFTNSLSWNKREDSTTSSGTLQLSRRLAGIGLSSQVTYLLAPETKIASLALTGDRNFGQLSRFSLGVLHALDPSQTTFTAGVTHNFGSFGIGLNGRYVDTGEYAVGMQLFMALGREPRTGHWVADWQPMAGSGAVSALAYLDANQNGLFDPGENPIEGAGFTINKGSRHPLRSNADGLAYLTRLTPRQYADIALDTSTLEDPQWLPTVKGMRMLPRPGKVQTIDFPVVMTGEVDGIVYLQEGGKTRGIGNALVELVDDRGGVAASGLSSSDGYYVVQSVRPGHYKARISPGQLDKLKLASTAPVELTMRADGEFVYGLNFTLRSKPEALPEKPASAAPGPAAAKVTKTVPLPGNVSVRVPAPAIAAAPRQQISGGKFVLESMICQQVSDCDAMTAKIRRLGYEPALTPVDATIQMQRLMLGPFTGKKLKQALALARTIEPGAYSVHVGDSYVIHAGAYLMQEYIDRQVRRFAVKGIKVHLEPVQVSKTLHRLRFGSFASLAEAEAASRTASAAGLQVEVVRFR